MILDLFCAIVLLRFDHCELTTNQHNQREMNIRQNKSQKGKYLNTIVENHGNDGGDDGHIGGSFYSLFITCICGAAHVISSRISSSSLQAADIE